MCKVAIRSKHSTRTEKIKNLLLFDEIVKSLLRKTLSILGGKRLRCSALRNANCLSALARVERHASLRVSVLAEHLECAQNARGVRKIDFLRDYLVLVI